PAMAFGNGVCCVAMSSGLKSLPVTVTNPPGATGFVRSAELTMLVRCGVGTAASKFQGIAVKPDCVSEMIAFRLKSGARVRVNGLTPVLVLDVAVAAGSGASTVEACC